MTKDIHPVIISLGSLQIRWYGVIMALAVTVGAVILYRQALRRGTAGEHVLGAMLFWGSRRPC